MEDPIEVLGESAHDIDRRRLQRARAGDPAAFAELYEQHRGAAMSVARRHAASLGTAEVEDIVSEAFLAVERAIGSGHGPSDAFLPYLLTVVRNRSARARTEHDRSVRLRARLEVEAITEVPDIASTHQPAHPASEEGPGLGSDSLLAKAYRILPERWQRALWLSEVEGRPVRSWAEELGLSVGAASALAYRARRALREEYLRAYGSVAAPDCRGSVGELQRLAELPAGDRIDALARAGEAPTPSLAHVTSCTHCRNALRGIEHPGIALATLAGATASGTVAVAGSGGGGLQREDDRPADERGGSGRRVIQVLGVAAGLVAVVAAILTWWPGASPRPAVPAGARPSIEWSSSMPMPARVPTTVPARELPGASTVPAPTTTTSAPATSTPATGEPVIATTSTSVVPDAEPAAPPLVVPARPDVPAGDAAEGVLRGRVHRGLDDGTTSPWGGVLVEVVDPQDGSLVARQATDRSGGWSFTLPSSAYDLFLWAPVGHRVEGSAEPARPNRERQRVLVRRLPPGVVGEVLTVLVPAT